MKYGTGLHHLCVVTMPFSMGWASLEVQHWQPGEKYEVKLKWIIVINISIRGDHLEELDMMLWDTEFNYALCQLDSDDQL